MRFTRCVIFPIIGLWTTIAAAQNTGGQSPGLQGTAPRVNVQNSANGTLDVGGGTDLNLQGENFRGTFGASRSQPGASVLPTPAPRPLPGSSFQAPFGAPDFAPSLPGTPTRVGDPTESDFARDLILPRFRSRLGAAQSSAEQRAAADSWRYRYFDGRWWFWQPNQSWLYWSGRQWTPYAAAKRSGG
jgi:hypothetical protein